MRIMRAFLLFGSAYFFLEFVIHFFNIRLWGLEDLWPVSARSYASILDQFYGSMALFIAGLLFIIQKDFKKYSRIIFLTSVWAFLHGLFLIYLSLSQDFSQSFASLPQLTLWLPFYNQFLLLEATALLGYALTVWLWIKKHER